jgi:hypothetical protein
MVKAKASASAAEPVTAVVPVAVAATADPAIDPPIHLCPGGEQSSPGRFFLKHHFVNPSFYPMKIRLISNLFLFAGSLAAMAANPADLIRLYEDEILAHDLYVALGKMHPDIMPLKNIPHSEARHREMMAEVLKAEGIEVPKPADGKRFVSEGLDATFAQWLAEGSKSPADACRVGTRLEDHDIAELRKAQIDFPRHKEMLSALESASHNHFRAFHRNLTSRGGKYKAEALPAAEIRKILKSENQCGGCGGACDAVETKPSGRGKGRRYRGGS